MTNRGAYTRERNPKFDAELDRNPPIITWAKNRRGVMVAVEVHDPHAETSISAQCERLRRSADSADREAAALHAEDARLRFLQQEADEVAERRRKHRADNTPLMTAARTAL